jgi:hypothetical protein
MVCRCKQRGCSSITPHKTFVCVTHMHTSKPFVPHCSHVRVAMEERKHTPPCTYTCTKRSAETSLFCVVRLNCGTYASPDVAVYAWRPPETFPHSQHTTFGLSASIPSSQNSVCSSFDETYALKVLSPYLVLARASGLLVCILQVNISVALFSPGLFKATPQSVSRMKTQHDSLRLASRLPCHSRGAVRALVPAASTLCHPRKRLPLTQRRGP